MIRRHFRDCIPFGTYLTDGKSREIINIHCVLPRFARQHTVYIMRVFFI